MKTDMATVESDSPWVTFVDESGTFTWKPESDAAKHLLASVAVAASVSVPSGSPATTLNGAVDALLRKHRLKVGTKGSKFSDDALDEFLDVISKCGAVPFVCFCSLNATGFWKSISSKIEAFNSAPKSAGGVLASWPARGATAESYLWTQLVSLAAAAPYLLLGLRQVEVHDVSVFVDDTTTPQELKAVGTRSVTRQISSGIDEFVRASGTPASNSRAVDRKVSVSFGNRPVPSRLGAMTADILASIAVRGLDSFRLDETGRKRMDRLVRRCGGSVRLDATRRIAAIDPDSAGVLERFGISTDGMIVRPVPKLVNFVRARAAANGQPR
jgi:hypothetical protein